MRIHSSLHNIIWHSSTLRQSPTAKFGLRLNDAVFRRTLLTSALERARPSSTTEMSLDEGGLSITSDKIKEHDITDYMASLSITSAGFITTDILCDWSSRPLFNGTLITTDIDRLHTDSAWCRKTSTLGWNLCSTRTLFLSPANSGLSRRFSLQASRIPCSHSEGRSDSRQ